MDSQPRQNARGADTALHQGEMPGIGADKRYFDEFRGLDGDPDDRDGQPALVGGLNAFAGAARNQRQRQDADREDEERQPQTLQNDMVIQIRHDKGHDDAQHRHGKLHFQLALPEIVHRSPYREQSETGQYQRADKQNGVHTSEKVVQGGADRLGGPAAAAGCVSGHVDLLAYRGSTGGLPKEPPGPRNCIRWVA